MTASADVTFETREARNGRAVAFVHLARPRQLNALTADMCEAMLARFGAWAADESIACVVLDGEGERAFCSGGDVVSAVRAIREGGPRCHEPADRLFAAEYRLVQTIFEFGKPVVSWAHGITMGAGLGLAVAASHRIVSPSARAAMPESRIGLFPDVGATWFLGRAPANCGPLIALCGATLGASDATYCGLFDFVVPESARAAVYENLVDGDLSGEPRRDRTRISALLASAETAAALTQGELSPRYATLRRIGRASSVIDLRRELAHASNADRWFADALASLDAGSPTSLHVGFEHFRRMRGQSLRDTLAADLALARAFVRGRDFPEGVRAALIDKDRAPRWQPASLDQVTASIVDAHFA